jgi:hypothetical protein
MDKSFLETSCCDLIAAKDSVIAKSATHLWRLPAGGNDHGLASAPGASSRWVKRGPAERWDGRNRWQGLYAAPLRLSRTSLARADVRLPLATAARPIPPGGRGA